MDRGTSLAGYGLALLCGLLSVAGPAGVATAEIVADGNLADWGVTPFSDWEADLAPNVVSLIADWPTPNYPAGGEPFDIEALYLAADATNLYLAVVHSMPEAGLMDPYGRPVLYTPGDFALNLDFRGGGPETGQYGYEFGVRTTGGPALNDPDGTSPGDRKGAVYHLPDWALPDELYGSPANGPSTMSGGTYVGSGLLVYVDADEAYNGPGGTKLEGTSSTYVIEAVLPWGIFGSATMTDLVAVHFTTTSGYDSADVGFDKPSGKVEAIPEPGSLLILGGGLVMGVVLRRRSRG